MQLTRKSTVSEFRKVQGLVGELSFSIVLPKSFAIDLGIGKGDFVKVFLISNKIIIEKADNGVTRYE